MKDPKAAQADTTGQTGHNMPSWPALIAGVLAWAGALVALFAVFWAVAQGLDTSDDGDNSSLLTVFAAGVLFATQVISAIAGASTFILLDKRPTQPTRAAVIFAVAACALGLLGTLLYVVLPAREGTFGVEASASMLSLYLMCLAADGAAAAGVSYFVARVVEGRRQRRE